MHTPLRNSHSTRTRLFRGLLVLLWAAFIFALSAQPSLPHPARLFNIADEVGDYASHAAAFAILAGLSWYALRAYSLRRPETARLAALIFSALYAASDEFHQSFVPGRTASVWDWLADCVGAGLMLILVNWLQRRRARSRPETHPLQQRDSS